MVYGECARVSMNPSEEGTVFKTVKHSPRYRSVTFPPGLTEWPGRSIGTDIEPCTRGFVVEPDAANDVMLRVRRFPVEPVRGIVIGETFRWEGQLVFEDGNASLGDPRRRVEVYEIALQTSRKAQIVFCSSVDVKFL